MRSKVLQEIIETEKSYVNTLNDIVDVSIYIMLLLETGKSVFICWRYWVVNYSRYPTEMIYSMSHQNESYASTRCDVI